MRYLHRHTIVIAALACSIVAANAAGIGPGSPAPALDVKTWYKGTPVKEFEKGKTYVVEFWATWCGPCKTSIPHLTELAQKNKDVTFIGVSIWEDDNGTNIKQFVSDMGSKMDYNIGYSGNKEGMAVTWMQAAGQNGIPSAFIVKDSVIQWVGHPMEMEKPLAEVKAGTFDLKSFKATFDKQAEENRAQMAARSEIAAAQKLISGGQFADAKAKIADIEKKYPSVAPALKSVKFGLLAKENPSEWEKQAKALSTSGNAQSIQTLWMFAMDQTQKGGDLTIGAKAMDLALEGNADKDVIVIYYGAYFFNMSKDYKKAAALADRALTAYPSSQLKDNKEFKAAIEKIKADASSKANSG